MAKKKKNKKSSPPTVKSILKELDEAMHKGLGKKGLSGGAKAYWTDLYTQSVTARLENDGDWEAEKKRVLKAAKKLGAVARVLTDGKNVSKAVAELAADAISKYPGCPGLGEGGWCPQEAD
jgi:hypothetical protein